MKNVCELPVNFTPKWTIRNKGQILAKWNHKHGEEKKLVFLPLKWEDDSYPDARDVRRRRY